MCTEIYVPGEKLVIQTIGDLRARVGAENVKLTASASWDLRDATPEEMAVYMSDNVCLCGIDTDHAARSAGFYGVFNQFGRTWKRLPRLRSKPTGEQT